MTTIENRDEFIDNYLLGKLNLYELSIAERKIKEDDMFCAEVDSKRNILLALREHKKQQLKNRLNSITPQSKIVAFFPTKSSLIKYSFAASIALIITISGILISTNSRAGKPDSKRAVISLSKHKI